MFSRLAARKVNCKESRGHNPGTYIFYGVLDGGQDLQPEKVHTKVAILLQRNDPQNLPSGGAAVEARIGQSLGEDDVDDLLSEEQLATLVILDDVADGRGGGASGLGVGAPQVLDDGQDALLSQGDEFRVGGRLDGLDGHRVGALTVCLVPP